MLNSDDDDGCASERRQAGAAIWHAVAADKLFRCALLNSTTRGLLSRAMERSWDMCLRPR
jgi:hypothetical protein